MTIERGLRLAAGIVVLLSVAIGLFCQSRLVAIDSFCRIESTAIGIYELVPDGMCFCPLGIPALRGSNSTMHDTTSQTNECLGYACFTCLY